MARVGFCFAVLLAGLGCASPPAEAPAPPDQLTIGEQVYASNCAGCHGENGEGTEGRPPLVGEKALPVDPPEGATSRKSQLKTAQDLFDYVKSDMPPMAPGSLSDDEYWAVVAWQLKANGVGGKVVTAANAGSMALHK
jgi:S-disulfanyl-L-cysteine oxidoreductase SoxD